LRCTAEDTDGNQNPMCINQERAVTKVQVLEYGRYKGKDCTKVMLELLTGRRHQLRVHLKYLGHPIVGDLQYGSGDYDTYRSMLHAYTFKMKLNLNRGKFENIEAVAPDPFVSEVDANWRSETVINKI
jgi:23S rRNA-/tRNA-specific pseudouridylate synthase